MDVIDSYQCPNCLVPLAAEAESCPRCNASFEGANAWKPVRRNIEPTRAPATPEDPTLSVLRILGYVSLVFWPTFLFAAGMAFDAPNAERRLFPYAAIAIAAAYGALPFITPTAARALLRRGRRGLAIAVAAVPISIFPLLTVLNFAMYLVVVMGR